MHILLKHIKRYFATMSFVFMLSYSTFAQFNVEDVIKKIDDQYEYTQRNKSVSSLVCLDSMLRAFVDSTRKILHFGDHVKHWKVEYSKLALEIGHYSEEFEYSGKFLFDAHSLDPNSPYRSSTLYASIVGIGPGDKLGWFPSIDVAFQYIKEFPHGRFIYDVYIIIADFYTDLYMALREGKERASYHYDCLERYIDKTPISDQLSRAQKQSIYYYEQALNERPINSSIKDRIQEIKNGTVSGWSTCAD